VSADPALAAAGMLKVVPEAVRHAYHRITQHARLQYRMKVTSTINSWKQNDPSRTLAAKNRHGKAGLIGGLNPSTGLAEWASSKDLSIKYSRYEMCHM
jgi:hypothetical protein